MSANAIVATEETDKIRKRFHGVLMKANKERPRESDIKALRSLLDGNRELKLWETVVGKGELAESQVLDTIVNGSGHARVLEAEAKVYEGGSRIC